MTKILSIIPNSVPMWAIYAEQDGTLYSYPIICLALVRQDDDDEFDETGPTIQPIVFDKQYLDIDDNITNFLGLSLTPNPDPKEFENELKSFLEKQT